MHVKMTTKAAPRPLGQSSGRGVVLPIAVSPHGGVHEFQVARQAGCSSLLKRNLNSEWGMDLQPV